ncbi:hypothetical protein SAMN05444274_103318 [Mariniphaga anaerophila]|uniref:Type IX secretion system membrane protein, PorP/SprF family n=1 Tax=Mariniphaga anaerophila TaxID=1484053 RepID=A0A1M4YDG8_9BACT|nr:hypothetical protein [Mariniphaga anaerophila]SHF03769.1 hypothetical protein SAMN05444274_103318 [Mariniphaga anaerophila]
MKNAPNRNCFSVLISVILLSGVFNVSFAQENYPVGARSLGLSHAAVSLSDSWAVFHNQAGIAGTNGFFAGFFYESRFGVELLSLSAGSVVMPFGSGAFGLSFFQFGEGAFKEHKFGLAYARTLSEKWKAGIQLDYFSRAFPENERARGFATFEGGVLFQPSEKLYLGVHVFNPVSGGINTPSGKQEMPVVFRVGGHYRFSEMVLAAFETETDNQNPVLLKTGIEFLPVENLAFRIGVSGKPFKYTAGIGYKTGSFSGDLGFGYHGNLGITPSVSVQFQLE